MTREKEDEEGWRGMITREDWEADSFVIMPWFNPLVSVNSMTNPNLRPFYINSIWSDPVSLLEFWSVRAFWLSQWTTSSFIADSIQSVIESLNFVTSLFCTMFCVDIQLFLEVSFTFPVGDSNRCQQTWHLCHHDYHQDHCLEWSLQVWFLYKHE